VLDSGTAHAGLLTQAEEVGAGVIVVGPGGVAKQVVRHAPVPVLVARPSSRGVVVGATDFSDPSLPGLELAAWEARRRHTRLHLVHALDMDMFTVGQAPAAALPYLEGTSAISMDGLDNLREAAQQRLSDMLTRTGVPGDATVVSGHASTAIVRVAETAPAELVVIGTHGRSGLARMTLGSTAEAVIDQAPCSVLVRPTRANQG
jgi:nucleotide-binding universal stress UspA family protein